MSELKPCPFCGHTPMIFNQAGLVTCRYAMCSANPQANSKEDWNKRTETEHLRLKEEENKQLQQDKAELVEALKALVKVEHERGGTLGVSGSFNYPVPEGVFIKAKKLLEKHK